MFKNYFKTAFRSIWKSKTYSLLNVFGLAIGIACAALIFLWAEDENTFDNVNVKKDRLYALLTNQTYGGNAFTNWSSIRAMGQAIQKEIPGVVNTCRVSDESQNALFNTGDKVLYAEGKYADPSLFSMFTLHFLQGDAKDAFRQLYSIVITEKAAIKFFGNNRNIVGKTVRMNNKQDYVVTGVLQDLPENSTLQFEWLAPYEVTTAEDKANGYDNSGWDGYGPFTYVELSSPGKLASVNRQLYNYIHSKNPTQPGHSFLFPMSDWHLRSEFTNGKQTGGRIEQVHLLSAIAWIILLIACINFMNLSTARSEKRAKEVGVRKVLGSGKRSLIFQFIFEALCMAGLAAILSILVVLLALPAFNQLMQKQLSAGLGNPVHIAALLILTIICGLVAGSYPSLYLSSFKPVAVLKGLKIKTGGAAIIRKGLVVLQFTVSVVFIISTIIIYMQVQHVKNRKLGLNKDNLVELDMQHNVSGIFETIRQDLLHTGVVDDAALANHAIIYGGDTDDGFTWQGKSPNSDISISFRKVSPTFIHTCGMHIIEGRDFGNNAVAENTNIIINKSLANLLSKGSAVGSIIQSPRDEKEGTTQSVTVIGVVDDYVFGNMYEDPGPVIFFCRPADYENRLYIRLKQQAGPQEALAKIEAVMKKDNPAYPMQYKFVDDQFNQMFISEVQMSKVSGIFAVLAIIISCLGLFGLAAYTAERRVKEIGIRKVLGAGVAGLTTLLSKDFLQLVGVSCLISFPVAGWMMHNWLQHYEYRIGLSWWIFVSAGSMAILIALVTISFQTIKAALANPVKALRSE
ncbi:MAG TPA: ABC transporter permease [Chitinophagaceae bacterium]|nr:ABC transporter permease [Chitinophagaceae bacterium]